MIEELIEKVFQKVEHLFEDKPFKEGLQN